jgi:transcriptional regulator GlxA family with amidase domain
LDLLGQGALSRLGTWLTLAPDLQAALDLLESDPVRAPGNAVLARRCGFGMDHFIRKFKAHTGMTPVQFRLDRKVARAAQLLTSTSQTLEEIAEITGFSDRYHLGRVFSRRFSIGPAAYRKLHGLETGRDAGTLWSTMKG